MLTSEGVSEKSCREKKALDAVEGVFGKNKKPKFDVALVLSEAATDHIQRTVALGTFFSLPRQLAGSCGLTLDHSDDNPVAGSITKKALKDSMELEMDGGLNVDAAQVPGSAASQRLFCKLISPRPSRLKKVPLGAADARRLRIEKYSVCVTFHDSETSDETGATISSTPLPNAALLSIAGHNLPLVQDSLLAWRFSGDPPSFSFPGIECPSDIIQRCRLFPMVLLDFSPHSKT